LLYFPLRDESGVAPCNRFTKLRHGDCEPCFHGLFTGDSRQINFVLPRLRHSYRVIAKTSVEEAAHRLGPAGKVAAPRHAPVTERYQTRLANSPEDRISACELRFRVFNIEMGEGLSSSYSTGLDEDPFDMVCDHLVVEDRSSGRIVGTYRMQSGFTAQANLGYYSERECVFAPYEGIRHQILELGRASIDRQHRSSEVLMLLWRGIADYARLFGLRYLIGCSSIPSQDPQVGWVLYEQLSPMVVREDLRTVPTKAFELPQVDGGPEQPAIVPRLLQTYLAVGAKICGPPAWDREFGTIDFLTLLDLEQLSPAARSRFLGDER
jgi:putative hemolysin